MTNMVKTSLLCLKVAVTSLLLLTSINAIAARCIDVFPTVLSSPYNDGEAELNWDATLSGTIEGNLDIGVEQNENIPPRCNGYICEDSRLRSQSLNLPSFKQSNSSKNRSVAQGQTREFLQGNYEKIELAFQSTAHFKINNRTTKIKELISTNSETTLIFDEGVYWIEKLSIGSNTKMIINGDDNVTLIIKDPEFESSPTYFNVNGSPDQLVLIAYNDIKFGSNANFKGFIYTDKTVDLKSPSDFTGAINGKKITLGANAAVKYAPDSIEYANFNGFCSIDDATLKTPIFSPLDGILGGQLKGQSNGTKFHIGKAGNGNNQWPSNEGPEHLIDDVGQKYLNFGELNTGAIITPAIGCSVVDSIKFWTANDNVSRDPASYKLYGTNTSISDTTNPLSSFTLLAEGPLALPSSRNPGGGSGLLDTNSQTISFTNSSSYSSYLLYFPTVKTERSANSMQLGEVQVYGTTRSCAVPVLEYRFDEASWDGTAGEVDDNSNTGLDGHAVGNANTVSVSEGKVCRAGTFDGRGDYIDVSGISSYLNSTASLSFWIKTNQSGSNTAWQAPGILGIEQSGGVDDIFWGYLDQTGHIGIQKGDELRRDPTVSTTSINNDTWHHVVLTRDSLIGDVQIFVNGKLERSSTSNTGKVNTSFSSIGLIENSKYFGGQLDELLVFDSVLSASEIWSIYTNQLKGNNYDGTERVCPSEPSKIDHYQIIHDGQGLTCEAEKITIKACTNSYDGTCTLSSEDVTLDVTAKGPRSRSSTDTANLVAGIGTANIAYTFDDLTTLSLSSAGTNSTVCVNGSSTSCDLVFANAGFRFLSGALNETTMPNQIAGVEFPKALKIQAVEDTNGVCTGLFSGVKSINLWQENVVPGGTDGLRFNVDNSPLAKREKITNTSLTFGLKSIAIIPTPVYQDAGQIRLRAGYDDGTVQLSGSSEPFWVSPDRLAVIAKSGSINLDGATAAAITTHKAGGGFDLIVSAYNANNIITPNYVPGQIQLKLERTGPTLTGSVDGDFSYASASTSTLQSSINPVFTDVNLTSFVTGVSTYDKATYSEVGLLNLGVRDRNYGDENMMVEAAAIAIGRFKPDHFKQTVAEHGELFATCGANSPFAYSGQMDETDDTIGAITYLTKPELKITAHNAQGDPTINYTDDFAKLKFLGTDGNEISFNVPARDLSNGLALTGNLPSLGTIVDLGNGVLTYTLSQDDNFVYTRDVNSETAPFQANFELRFNEFKDSDEVTFKATDVVSGEEYFETPKFNSAVDNTVEIRFGRLILKNSFGPETVNLTQPLQVEYYNGNNFIVSVDDNCLGYDDGKLIPYDIEDLDPTVTKSIGGTGTFFAGETRAIQLEAPGVGKKGNLGVLYDLNDTQDWLQYNWDNDMTNGWGNDNPSAVATFGLFGGNDRLIYRRRLN